VLLTCVLCSVIHPLMGISLDGIFQTPVLLIKCSLTVQFMKNTSLCDSIFRIIVVVLLLNDDSNSLIGVLM
jgi:hypothetical protein